MKKLRVLIACEFSGIVREAFKSRGHDAWSCDLLDTEIPGNHLRGDVRNLMYSNDIMDDGSIWKWDLLIAHPPCTRLANSGVRWLNERNLFEEMKLACDLFNQLLNAPIDKICVENPIQHKYAREFIRKYDQIIQPWMFGHEESKAICLWLKNLPPLLPTQIMQKREQRVWKESPGVDRWKNRSRFYTGIANAMAEQWG